MITNFFETTIDWDRVSVICFTQGCNFRCSYCHNKDLIPRKVKVDKTQEFLEYLSSDFVKAFKPGVVISGGEPTIWGEKLKLFISQIKQLGYNVKLDTNGSNPQLLKELIDNKLIDAVYMDIKSSFSMYKKVTNSNINLDLILQSIKILNKANIDVVFRTTLVEGLVELDDVEEVCEVVDRKYQIQFESGTSEDFKKFTVDFIKAKNLNVEVLL